MTAETDIDAIVAGMTEAQKRAVPAMSDTWMKASRKTFNSSAAHKMHILLPHLVERRKYPTRKNLMSATTEYRLTHLGLAVRARLGGGA